MKGSLNICKLNFTADNLVFHLVCNNDVMIICWALNKAPGRMVD